jgi:hypothetical protein
MWPWLALDLLAYSNLLFISSKCHVSGAWPEFVVILGEVNQ